MKWLNVEMIRRHLRVDGGLEDELLEMYGESAEETVLNYLRRDYASLVYVYGEVPKPVVHASLMLVDLSYQYRTSVNSQHLSLVPYTFDLLLKPYMLLGDDDGLPVGVLYDVKGKLLEDVFGRVLAAAVPLRTQEPVAGRWRG